VSFEPALLEEILRLKGFGRSPGDEASAGASTAPIDVAEAARVVKMKHNQLWGYLKGRPGRRPRAPQGEALRRLADALELDGNFLLKIGRRFDGMTTRQALAHMALDRYDQIASVDSLELEMLKKIADEHPTPPMWADVWRQTHTSLMIVQSTLSSTPARPRDPRSVQDRRLPRRGPRSV
jgi:hypothetical protein